MRAKKATKAPRSVRYLLSADRRFQKLSLRKLSARLTRAKQRTRSNQPKNTARPKRSERRPWAITRPVLAVGVICMVGAAALIAARQPAPRADVGTVEAPLTANAPTENASLESAPVEHAQAKRTVLSKQPVTAAVSRTRAADASTAKQRPIESVKAPASESTVNAVAPSAVPVTITGCVELDGQTFWLKDTSGVAAPRARSWRSGFLKRRPSRIELVKPVAALRLPDHVGQRVAVTGVLENREMRARSLRPVAASCK